MGNKWVWGAALLAAGYFLYKGFNKIWSNIEYGFTRVKISWPRVNGDGTVTLPVQVTQPIINKNAIPFPLDNITGGLYYGNDRLATFSLPAPVSIAANTTTDLRFDGLLSLQGVATELEEILRTNQWLQSLRFKGEATSAGVTFPFDHTVSIG